MMNKATGRPSKIAGKALDKRILEVSRREFFKKGYQATSVDNISKIVKCSKPTIYRRFRSKSGLFTSVVKYQCRHLFDDIPTLIKNTDNPLEELKIALQELFDFRLDKETVATQRILIADNRHIPDVVENVFTKIAKPYQDRIEHILRRILTDKVHPKKLNKTKLYFLSRNLPGILLYWPLTQALCEIEPFPTKEAKQEYFSLCWGHIVHLLT